MRLLMTGEPACLAARCVPSRRRPGHEVAAPGREELFDLFDPSAVADAARDVDGVLHLATRIRSFDRFRSGRVA